MDGVLDEILHSDPVKPSLQDSNGSIDGSSDLVSPLGVSRYGRQRKPKISEDFCNIDDAIQTNERNSFKYRNSKSPNKTLNRLKSPKKEISKIKVKEFITNKEHQQVDHVTGDSVCYEEKNNVPEQLSETPMKVRKFFKSSADGTKLHNVKKMYINQRNQYMDTNVNTACLNSNLKNNDIFESSPIDVSKVLKIVSCASDESKFEIDKKPNTKSILKTYCNKRKPFNKLNVIESFALPDEPIIPLCSNSPTKPKRIAEIDVDMSEPESVNLVNKNKIDAIWEPLNGNNTDVTSKMRSSYYFDERIKTDMYNANKSKSEYVVTNDFKSINTSNSAENYKVTPIISLESNTTNGSILSAIDDKRCLRSKSLTPKLRNRNVKQKMFKNELHYNTFPRSKRQIVLENNNLKRTVSSTTTKKNNTPVESCLKLLENEHNCFSKKYVNEKFVDNIEKDLVKSDSSLNISDIKNQITNKMEKLSAIENIDNLEQSDTTENEVINECTSFENEEMNEYNCNMKVKEENLSPVTPEYDPGEILWAKVGSHPYWPCITSTEPLTGNLKKYQKHKTLYHVRFFGDNGRRSWVPVHNLIPYKSNNDLTDIQQTLRKKNNKKQIIPPQNTNKYKCWLIACDEAESLKNKNMKERLNFFVPAISKRYKKPLISDKLKELSNVQVEENFIKYPNERKKTKSKSLQEFNVEKGTNEVQRKDEDAEISFKMARRFTRSSLQKNTNYIRKHPIKPLENNELIHSVSETSLVNQRKLNHTPQNILGSECSYSDTDSNSKMSLNSPIPVTLESQVALYKRNNLFKGIPKERVCEICEKDGIVFKCKGPCSGYYHTECARDYKSFSHNSSLDSVTDKSVNLSMHGQEIEINSSISNEKIKSPMTNYNKNVEIVQIKDRKTGSLPQLTLNPDPDFKNLPLLDQIDQKMKEVMKRFENYTQYADSTTDYTSSEESTGENLLPENNTIKTNENGEIINIPNNIESRNENTTLNKTKLTSSHDTDFKCNNCLDEVDHECFVCHKYISKNGSNIRQKCSIFPCGKFYHPECLKQWPQTQWSLISTTKHKNSGTNLDTFVCPLHVCHTCVSDDPRAAISRCQSNKVVKCLRCPATYHTTNYCIPAGTEILSTRQVVCPRHLGNSVNKKSKRKVRPINTTWCFICSKGGDLICCETCPTSVHIDCLNINLADEDTFMCEDCETGRFPLYDEIVWVKLGKYRWWPAVVLFPNEIPDNVRNISHNKGEFVVKFFGTHDHYWISRGRVFLFQEGDSGGHANNVKRKVDEIFRKSVEEATSAHRLKKDFKATLAKEAEIKTGLKPPPYIKIKINRPVGNVRLYDGNISNTTPCECDPKKEYPCGPDSDCLNRLLSTECNPEICPAGNKCQNQNFEKRIYPPLVPYKTESRGWGLKSLEHISKGQFVIEYVGEIIDEQEYQRRIKKMHEQKEENYYFLTIDKDRMIDAGPKGNVARFMNHCCQPNCETQKWTVNGDTRVGLFAKEDIPINTELTFNYNLECVGKEKKICKCGAPNCSGFIGEKTKQDESQKKVKKPSNKNKKKRRSPSLQVTKVCNPCFKCGETGDVGACQNKICTKFYHLQCVNLELWPESKWICPWHNCNICSKRTIRCCFKCINSYCPVHSEGNVRYDKLLGFVCTQHDPSTQTQENITQRIGKQVVIPTKITEENDVTSTTFEELSHCLLEVNDDMSTNECEEPENQKTPRKENKSKNNILKCRTSTPITNDNSQFTEVLESSINNSYKKDTDNSNRITKKRGRSRNLKNETFNTKKPKLKEGAVPNLVKKVTSQNEVVLLNTVPLRHLRTSKVIYEECDRVLKRHKKYEKDLPIRKRSTLRCEATV